MLRRLFLLLFATTLVSTFSYRAEDVTVLLNRLHGKKHLNRDDIELNAFFHGQRYARQDYPINHYYDNNPESLPIPTGMPTIKIGYVITDITGYYVALFNNLAYQGLRVFEYLVNNGNGVVINGTRYWIEIVAYNGGPSCSNFLVLYQRLIEVDKVNALISPVNGDCPEVTLLAELYQIPVLNGIDFGLDLAMPYPPFNTTRYTYSIAGDILSLGASCIVPVFAKGAKTYAIFYDPLVIDDTIPIVEGTAQALGMTKVLNTSILSTTVQTKHVDDGDNCSYIWTFIDKFIEADPDLLIGSFGAQYTDMFIDCMHRRKLYQPRAFWLLTGSTLLGSNLWQTDWSFSTDLWVARANFSDPYLGSVAIFNNTFARQYGADALSQISFAASNAEAAAIMLSGMVLADSLEPDDIIAALPYVNHQSILGEIFLQNGTHHYYHPFFCKQRNNDSNPIGLPVFPYETPGVVEAQYPTNVVPTQEFLDSLKEDNSLTRDQKFGIGFGVGFGVLFVILAAIVIGYLIYTRYYEVMAFPKDFVNKSKEEW